MPDLNGYGTLAALCDDPDISIIPVIFLTVAASRANMRKDVEMGTDDYITKFCTVEELLAAVRTRLDRQGIIKRRSAIDYE
jgi:DNA-binding response OmpR family regulator